MDSDIISNNVALATEYYKYLNAKAKETNSEFSSTIGFVPFNLSLTLDGISGIKIYNKLNVNTSFLPTNYPKTLKFIIKGVNHVLQNSDWETTLETVVTSENMDPEPSYKHLQGLIHQHIEETKSTPTLGEILTAPFVSDRNGASRNESCPVLPSDRSKKPKTDKEMYALAKKIFPELSPSAISGLLGFLKGESEIFNTNAYNPSGGGCGAFGISQWRGERQKNLFKFATNNNIDILSHETQLKFLKYELQNNYKKVWGLITNNQLNIFQYLAIPHLSSGLGNSNPYLYYNQINSKSSYLSKYTSLGGKSFSQAEKRAIFAQNFNNFS
jgi:hypothetical protein